MTETKDILNLLNTIAPFDLAEKWDNCGLQCGDMNWKVTKILVALDASLKVMDAAQKCKADMVVTHHPLMIHPIRQIEFSKMPGQVIGISHASKISIISVHTNLDKANSGLNDYFSALLGITPVKSLVSPANEGQSPCPETDMTGIGRVGNLKKTILFSQLIQQIKNRLNIPALKVTGDTGMKVKTVAVCTGSGGSLVEEFISSGARVYITGDTKYHEARLIEESGLGLVDVGHFASEYIAIDLLSEKLRTAFDSKGLDIEIKGYRNENDPFIIM